ncbi:MAG: lytic murein transglycosylase [Elusimicrobia bacterium]|nr:lytic murein transglycosylase [Elusimicrobiota bacterium]
MKRFLAAALLGGLAALAYLAGRPSGRWTASAPPMRPGQERLVPAEPAPPPAAGSAQALRPGPRSLRIAEVPPPGSRRVPARAAGAARAETRIVVPRLVAGRSGSDPGQPAAVFHVPQDRRGEAPPRRRGDGAPGPRGAPEPARVQVQEPSAPEAAATAGDRRAAAPQPEEASWAAPAARITQAAKELKVGGSSPVPPGFPAGSSPEAALMRQILMDRKVEDGLRAALVELRGSGRAVSPEAAQAAAVQVLEANGLAAEPEDVQAALAMAEAPPLAPPPPQALAATVAQMSAHLPDVREAQEINRRAQNPAPKLAPPPKGALEAFRLNRDALAKAERDFGVKPHHVLGILGVETAWGKNTGKHPVNDTLYAIATQNPPASSKARQASRDRAALARLHARGDLGGLSIDQVRGSYAGAMGVAQFLPSSWESFARNPDGGSRDPFDQKTAAYSAANYLYRHGYRRDVAGSIYGYNHSQAYVDKVLGLSRQIEQTLSGDQPKDQKGK